MERPNSKSLHSSQSENLGQFEPPSDKATDDLNLADVWRIIVRRRRIAYLLMCVCLLLGILTCAVSPKRYRAGGKIQLLKQDDSGISLSEVATGAGGGGISDALDFNLTLQTQVKVLESDTLAMKVIQETGLENTPSYRQSSLNPFAGKVDYSKPIASDPMRRAFVLKQFAKNLQVDTVSGTRIITVKFMDQEPQMAAKVLNQLLNDYLEYNFEERYHATTRAADWLGGQLVDLKAKVAESQENAVKLQRETGIFGSDETHNVVISKLDQLNALMTNAEANRVLKEAVYSIAKSGDAEAIAGLLGTSAIQASPSITGSISAIQNLTTQDAQASSELASLTNKYGPAYPRVIEAQQRLDSIRNSFRREKDKLQDRARAELEVSQQAEAAARAAFGKGEQEAFQMNDKAITYTIAKHEADSNRELYEHLLKRLKEAGVLSGLHSSDTNILDPGEVPYKPAQPVVPLIILLSLAAGVVVSFIAIFVVDSLDDSVRDPNELERTSGLSILAVLPQFSQVKHQLGSYGGSTSPASKASPQNYYEISSQLPRSVVSEAYRSLRTAILLSSVDTPLKVLMMTSCVPGEGKSTTTFNLATVLAQAGSRVLVIDADLRKGSLSSAISMSQRQGLATSLLGTHDVREAIRSIPDVPGLDFLPAGTCPPYPAEVLVSKKMRDLMFRLRAEYDYIVVDTPAMLPVTDAVAMSTQADAVIVIARSGVTQRRALNRCMRMLQRSTAPIIGIVLNGVDVVSPDYYAYSGYSRYTKYYGNEAGDDINTVPAQEEK